MFGPFSIYSSLPRSETGQESYSYGRDMPEKRQTTLKKIAVVGRGTAGSLAAANVTNQLAGSDFELHHIYDSRIPVIGVGEGSWPSLVQELHTLTKLPHEVVQQSIKGTRKYGVLFQGWGTRNKEFIHYFTPQQVSYAYHLAADLLADLLHDCTDATHIDSNVTSITRVDNGARLEFVDREAETYDLVFDARGFPKELDPKEHIDISFIPTNTAIIRRCSAIYEEAGGPELRVTYTRAVARPHGWVFVIPLTAHTSYGYIYNRNVSTQEAVEADFDELLDSDGIPEFEHRAVINFPNFVHRSCFDGAIARVGNAAAFMEPLEATAIVSAQLQIGMVLHMRLNQSDLQMQSNAPIVNRFLISTILRYGLFVGWHYSCGSKFNSEFWDYAREHVWSGYREAADPSLVDCNALEKFEEMLSLLRSPVIPKKDWHKMCAVPLTSYAQMSQGLGCFN